MDLKIGKKITKFRKKRNLTQEQVADYLNVSNAAVSKWESGISYPDIELLPKIASLFNISIDFLLGFDLKDENLAKVKETAENYLSKGNAYYEVTTEYLDDALIRYPNDLTLNLLKARSLVTKGLNSDPMNKDIAKKSIKYYDKALLVCLEGAGKDTIIQNKSFVLASIGEYEEANTLLKSLKNDRYTVQIANNLIKMGKTKEGMEMLQNYLNDFAFSFAWLVENLKQCFEKEGRTKEIYDLEKMNATFREFMTLSKKANYYDFLSSKDFLDLAIEALKNEDFDNLWISLEKAVFHALRFDKDPAFEVSRVHFLGNLSGEFYSGNARASGYILKNIELKFKQFSGDERYKSLVNKLNSV